MVMAQYLAKCGPTRAGPYATNCTGPEPMTLVLASRDTGVISKELLVLSLNKAIIVTEVSHRGQKGI